MGTYPMTGCLTRSLFFIFLNCWNQKSGQWRYLRPSVIRFWRRHLRLDNPTIADFQVIADTVSQISLPGTRTPKCIRLVRDTGNISG